MRTEGRSADAEGGYCHLCPLACFHLHHSQALRLFATLNDVSVAPTTRLSITFDDHVTHTDPFTASRDRANRCWCVLVVSTRHVGCSFRRNVLRSEIKLSRKREREVSLEPVGTPSSSQVRQFLHALPWLSSLCPTLILIPNTRSCCATSLVVSGVLELTHFVQ